MQKYEPKVTWFHVCQWIKSELVYLLITHLPRVRQKYRIKTTHDLENVNFYKEIISNNDKSKLNFLHHNVEFELMIWEAVDITRKRMLTSFYKIQHWVVMQEKKQQHCFYYQLELISWPERRQTMSALTMAQLSFRIRNSQHQYRSETFVSSMFWFVLFPDFLEAI